MNIGLILRQARLKKKLSQMEVARRSRISLATIQNIEAHKANPAWSTLSVLLKTLDLKLQVQSQPLDWSLLGALGCPLLTDSSQLVASRELLEESLVNLNPNSEVSGLDDRQTAALAAWLWALRDHYPSIYKKLNLKTRKWLDTVLPVSIKLRRLALSRLGNYL